jgi:hypothetical protein
MHVMDSVVANTQCIDGMRQISVPEINDSNRS